MGQTPRELSAFLRECLGERFEVDPLPGDASTRAYFRVCTPDGRSWMAAYYPPSARADVDRFLGAYRAIAPVARVPEVLRSGDCAVLQQDVGDTTLFELLETDPERAARLYRRAIDLLLEFQRSRHAAAELNPPFTAAFFRAELDVTREFWVERMCGVEGEVHERLSTTFGRLAESIASHPYVLCHRDYHGQNLHVIDDDIFIIDYQDLRMGPDTYDLASLLRDRGAARFLGRDAEQALIEYYRARIGADEALHRRYFETLLQRSVKIVGTFARQSILRGRHRYLAYIPPTLDSIRFCVDRLPEYHDLLETFPLDSSEAYPPVGFGA